MTGTRKSLGDFGEKVARAYLERRGYQIIEANYRCKGGEIDLVARDGDCLVVVEVRTRRGSEFGTPEESVTAAKVNRLRDLAETYAQEHPALAANIRIDVIAIEVGPDGKVSRTEQIKGIGS